MAGMATVSQPTSAVPSSARVRCQTTNSSGPPIVPADPILKTYSVPTGAAAELAKADPDWFGICLVTASGQIYEAGDSRIPFTIQSISKPFVYGQALEDNGRRHVLSKVGMEPTGDAFNSISLEPGTGRPRNPMINAGAIATTALIEGKSAQTRQRRLLEMFANYAGRPLILYFYPKDDTPGCTREACAFQETLPRFKPSKAAVLGVSVLDEASKARFAKKYGLRFPLLADPDHTVAEKYGVWQEKTQYGRTYMGIARTTYLIGPDGKVRKRWDRVKVDGHADDVLAALG